MGQDRFRIDIQGTIEHEETPMTSLFAGSCEYCGEATENPAACICVGCEDALLIAAEYLLEDQIKEDGE